MGRGLVKQDDGRWAEWSTITDSYTNYNMSFKNLLELKIINSLERIDQRFIDLVDSISFQRSEDDYPQTQENLDGALNWDEYNNESLDKIEQDLKERFVNRILPHLMKFMELELSDFQRSKENLDKLYKLKMSKYSES